MILSLLFIATTAAPSTTSADTRQAASQATAPLNFNFDMLAEPAQADSPEARLRNDRIQHQADTRRLILTLHTYIGYALLAAMTATVVLGQLNYNDKFAGGGYTNRYDTAHEVSSLVSTGLFATNGILALVAPTPYPKPGRWDTARIHRIFEAAATAGMVADIVLGPISETKYGQVNERDFANAHLAIGYATFALIVGGFIAYFFN